METIDKICAFLDSHRFNFKNEAELQQGIGALLTKLNIIHQREVRMGSPTPPRDHELFERVRGLGPIRLDFLCEGGVAIETKVFGNGSRVALIRQLERYSIEDRVTALLVVSDVQFNEIPRSINDKSVTIHHLTGGIF